MSAIAQAWYLISDLKLLRAPLDAVADPTTALHTECGPQCHRRSDTILAECTHSCVGNICRTLEGLCPAK
eukprot:3730353-Amphidinium_carterae.2